MIHISTGELLRAEIKNGTELGKKAKKFMDKGNLVPDELVIDVIKNKLNSCQNVKGFVFDGFPRTVAQAEALDELLCKNCMSISGMLSLEVEKQELIRRLIGRGLKYGRIDDQEQSVIEYRCLLYTSSLRLVMLTEDQLVLNLYFTSESSSFAFTIFCFRLSL